MITIFIEGTTATSAGNLRGAFRQLLEKAHGRQRFEIILGDDKARTARKFLEARPDPGNAKAMLVDLDGGEHTRAANLNQLGLQKEAHAHFMVQEMEAWFFSQPDVLTTYYGKDLKLGKYKSTDPSRIEQPARELFSLTAKTTKGKYHKVKHACDLLPRLDLKALRRAFPDVEAIVSLLEA